MFYVIKVKVGQSYVLCSDEDGDPILKPEYKACLWSDAWSFDSEEEAHEEALTQNFAEGSYEVVGVDRMGADEAA